MMKSEDKSPDEQLKFSSDDSKDTSRSFPSDFSIGGPYSAFSGIVTSHAPTMNFQHAGVHHVTTSPPIETLCGTTFAGPPFYSGRQSSGAIELPIAPAFAQIFQRRRRREQRPRRQRTTFTSEQTLKLELEYTRTDYITRPRRFELAERLSLSESQIKIWFQNRRAKDKRIEKAHMDHQLRSLGYNGVPGMPALPFPCSTLCETCPLPPLTRPALTPSARPTALPLVYDNIHTKHIRML